MGRKSLGTNLSQGEKWFPLWWLYYQWVTNWSSFHCRLTSAPSRVSRTFCLFPCCLRQSEIHWCLPFYTLGWDVCSSMRQRGRCPDLVSIDLHSWPFLPSWGPEPGLLEPSSTLCTSLCLSKESWWLWLAWLSTALGVCGESKVFPLSWGQESRAYRHVIQRPPGWGTEARRMGEWKPGHT